MRLVIAFLIGILACSSAWAYSSGEEAYFQRVADAIFRAEGGKAAKVPYGILSVKVRDEAHARQTCLEVIRWRWELHGAKREGFVEYLSRSYCPLSDKRDTQGLNYHWVRNVSWFLDKNNA